MLNLVDIQNIEQKLNYTYKNKNLLIRAFTHSSFANKNHIESNERLEFLGDSLLNLITTTYLYENCNYDEGTMSKIRAFLVSSNNLSKYIKSNNLIDYLKSDTFNPSNNTNVMGDLYESILASMFLDSDYLVAKTFVATTLNYSKNLIEFVYTHTQDYKTKLQEIVQQNPNNKLEYIVINKSGPAHNPQFEVAITLNGRQLATAIASNKKQAENACAKQIIDNNLV